MAKYEAAVLNNSLLGTGYWVLDITLGEIP
jgi:hypothetical protein